MTATTSAGPAPAPDRLRQISLAQRLLARPAAGALVIVVFVFIVFSVLVRWPEGAPRSCRSRAC